MYSSAPARRFWCSGAPPDPEPAARYCALVEKHASGYPLQYIVGEWEFLSLPIRVEEGVLIPRPTPKRLRLPPPPFWRAGGRRALSGTGQRQRLYLRRAGEADRLQRRRGRRQRNGRAPDAGERGAQRGGFAALHTPRPTCSRFTGNCRTARLISSYPTRPTSRRPNSRAPTPPSALSRAKRSTAARTGWRFTGSSRAAYAPKLREGGGVCFEIGYSQADSVMNILRKNGYIHLGRQKDYGGNDRVIMGIRAPRMGALDE